MSETPERLAGAASDNPMIAAARSRRPSSSRAMARGVKQPLEMTPRTSVWCGGSMFRRRRRWASIASRPMSPSKATIEPFSHDDHPSRAQETAFTSAWRDSTQNPPSSKLWRSGVCGFHHTGAVRRRSANSASGTRWA